MIDPSQQDELQKLTALFGSFSDLEAFACGDELDFEALMTLLWLQRACGCMAGVLSKELSLAPSTTTRTLKKLESLGLVEELLEPGDLRKCRFVSSQRGENIVFELTRQYGNDVLSWQMMRFTELKRGLRAAKLIQGHPLTGTAQRLMLVLHAAEHAQAQHTLCESARLPQSRTSMCLKKLADQHLIKRKPGGTDRRIQMIELTSEGRALASSMRANLFMEQVF